MSMLCKVQGSLLHRPIHQRAPSPAHHGVPQPLEQAQNQAGVAAVGVAKAPPTSPLFNNPTECRLLLGQAQNQETATIGSPPWGHRLSGGPVVGIRYAIERQQTAAAKSQPRDTKSVNACVRAQTLYACPERSCKNLFDGLNFSVMSCKSELGNHWLSNGS